MSDLVERLRTLHATEGGNVPLDAAMYIERLEKALREINQLRYTKRHTIHADNAYECAIGLNAAFLAAVDTARAALEDR